MKRFWVAKSEWHKPKNLSVERLRAWLAATLEFDVMPGGVLANN